MDHSRPLTLMIKRMKIVMIVMLMTKLLKMIKTGLTTKLGIPVKPL